ncbi:MAG TPA: hypothetical protein VGJ60_05075 [Chloroflexota bacterium]
MRSKSSPYRAGPWPGLTPRGAGLLLACAGFLAVGQVLIGPLEKPLPDLVVLGVTALMPMAIAERIIRAPGAAAATCGAYLLPRSLISLLYPGIASPPLLLVPAITLDLVLWVDTSHLSALRELLPGGHPTQRTQRAATPFSRTRALIAGGAFGLVLSLVEPAYQVFLGASSTTWSGPALWIAILATTAACGGLATLVTLQPTANS